MAGFANLTSARGKMIGDVTVDSGFPVAEGTTTVMTSGYAVPIHADTDCRAVLIAALVTNLGIIRYGISTSQSNELQAGDSIVLPCNNLNQIYIDADEDGEGITYFAVGV